MSKRSVAVILACLAVPPAVAIAHGPPKITDGPTGTVATKVAELKFSYEEPAPGQHFECRLDSGSWEDCGDIGPVGAEATKRYEGLADGPHEFRVRRVSSFSGDPLADETPSEARTWTVDTTAPDTTVVEGPVDGTATDARIVFSGGDGTAGFDCSVDGAAFAACTSPLSLTGLAVGDHRVAVRAHDQVGNADSTPAEHRWKVVAAAPAPVTASSAQPGVVPTVTVGKPDKKAKKKAKMKRCKGKPARKAKKCRKQGRRG